MRIVLSQATRNTRAALGPVAWAVLEDVLLDARHDDQGRLVAVTNVRRVAAHVGIAKDTAAKALARLAGHRLLARQCQQRSGNGEFVRSAYEVGNVAAAGVTVVTPPSPRPALAKGKTAGAAEQDRRGGDGPRRRRRPSRATRSEQGALFDPDCEASERA